jgi:phosphoglycolate phosphatase-like HAD superfamily hydrolase
MLRAIAFDFDGVLAESVDTKTQAYASLFNNESDEAVRNIVEYHLKHGGVSRFEKFKTFYREILQRPLSEERFQELCDQFSVLVVEKVVAAPWVDGAKEFLNKNKDRYKFFIISGTPEDELISIVKRRGMESFFESVLGSPATKDILLQKVMRDHHLQADEIAFVGDADTDWQAAKKTNIQFIWRRISGSTPTLEDFQGSTISNLHQLEECLG